MSKDFRNQTLWYMWCWTLNPIDRTRTL